MISSIRFLLCLVFLTSVSTLSDAAVTDLLLPGEVIEGHAKWEMECDECHKSFDKGAQSGLCQDCHKEIRKDVDAKQGYHGKMKEDKTCNECHTDHKGRDENIVIFDEDDFDHKQTDFVLKGGHLDSDVQCKDCHESGKKYREAPIVCYSCHKKDDDHKGELGKKCESCHVEKDWKTIKFDHDKTDFKLLDKHVEVKCTSCHKDEQYKDTPIECVACHKKDDKKAHKGKFGKKCETCHDAKSWEDYFFDHKKETKFPLLGKHKPPLECTECHKGYIYEENLKTTCVSCHKKDDKKAHKGKFGNKCETCHVESDWKKIPFDHDKTDFPLLGKHRPPLECTECHKGTLYKEDLKTDCYSCHKKDDKHKGQEGKKCESCHDEKSWDKTSWDHRLSTYPLTGKHLLVKCKECHKAPTYKDAKTDCWSCHEKEDVHKRRLGTKCETCHNTRDWKGWDYDHNKTKFKLDGKHDEIKCVECHKSPAGKTLSLAVSCVSCHDKDDKHDGAYGDQCERCHVGESWKSIKAGSKRWISR